MAIPVCSLGALLLQLPCDSTLTDIADGLDPEMRLRSLDDIRDQAKSWDYWRQQMRQRGQTCIYGLVTSKKSQIIGKLVY